MPTVATAGERRARVRPADWLAMLAQTLAMLGGVLAMLRLPE